MKMLIFLFFLVISTVLISTISLASTERTATTETICDENKERICSKIIYSGDIFAQNSLGEWVDASDVFRITRSTDILTFHYNGIKGLFNVSFESGAIYNGNYFSMSQVKQSQPNIQFNFPSTKSKTNHKYAINITRLNETTLNLSKIQAITLTYKEHSGFNLDQLTSENGKFIAKNIMQLAFDDLLQSHFIIRINKTERRIYIENLTDNIIGGSLYLDPTLSLNTTSGDGYVANFEADTSWATVHDGTSGTSVDSTSTTAQARSHGIYTTDWGIDRIFIPINTTLLPDNVVITNATFHFFVTAKTNGDNDGDDFVAIVGNTTQASNSTLGTADFDTCGAISSPTLFSNKIDIGSITTSAWNTFQVNTNGTGSISKTGITRFCIREGHDIINSAIQNPGVGTTNRIVISTKEGTNPPYLNVTYTFNIPTPNITYPINNSNLSNVKSINFTSSDTDGDALTYYVYANGKINTTSASNITQWNASDGRYYISVSAYDGTDFSSNTTINFTLDSTPPATTSTMTSPPDGASYTNNTWSSNNIKVTLSAFDALIGYNNLKFPMYCTDLINACYPATYIGSGATITAEGTNYFRYYSNDTLNNSETVKFEVLKIDKYVPTVNTTFNATPYINDFINFTGNITDSVGLLSANITYNMSGFITYANYTLSGTSAQVSNTTQLVGNGGTIINFTMFVTDTANQVKQNSTLVTIIDNVFPIVNTSFNTTNPVIGSVINFTGNVTDETGLLMANWTFNASGFVTKINYSLSGTSAQISNVTTLTRVDVVNFTLYVTDTSNNVKQNSTILIVTDNINPVVNTTFNVTNAKVIDIVNYTANITDETGLLMANWTVNLSTGKVYANYSISGTSAQISNATDLTSCVETCVLNFTIYATDTSNNVKQNSTLLSIADITTPIVNTTFNTTSPANVDFINFTGNVTDGVGLMYANWTVNLSTGKVFMNYSISGTSAQISNATNLYGLPAQVLNFTLYATDTSNNVKQNSTILSVSDAIKPVVNTSFNISNPTVNQVINFTGNLTDETGLLTANWTVNLSTGKIFMNYSISGTSAQVSNLTQLTTGIFNFTLYATDTSNNVRQNSTIITVTDNVKPVGNATLNSSVIRINDWVNSTINITDESNLQTANLTINLTTGKTFSNYSISGTEAQLSNLTQILASRGNVLNFSWIMSDAAGNIQQNDTVITIANTLPASPNILFPVSWSNYSNVTYLNYTSQADADSDAIAYKVYINGTLNHSVSSNITQFNASDGFYNLTVFANDGANSSNATVYFTLDTTPPVLNLISPYNGYIYTSLILDLNHSVYDSMVGLSSCWYQNGTNAPQNFTIGCNTNTTIQASAAGTNTTYFWANDTVGNIASASTTYTISLGSPAVNTLFPVNNTWYNYNQNVSFNFTVDDPNDNGIRNCSLYGNWSSGGEFIFNGTNTTNIVENQRYNITRNLTDGWYMYNVECWDITDSFFGWDANNKTFGIDATFPQINFTGLTLDNNTNTTATSIFINVSTNESNFNSITFELHNPDGLVSSVKFTELTNNITFAGLSDNTYYYNVTINDSAGNRNTTETRLIRLDDTSPSITLNHPQAQNYGYNNSLSLNYTVSDNVVGISSCWYYVYNSSGSLMIPSTTLANCQNSTFSLHGGSDTDYTLTLFSNDLLGNVNSQAVTFGIRMVSPAVVLDNPTNNQYFNNLSDIRLNFTPTDNDGISDCELWGNWSGEWKINQTNNSITSGVQYNFNKINVSLDEYGYKWNVWCNDTINNSDFALNNFTFYTDTKIPNASLISPSSTTYTSLSFSLQHIESDYSLNTCKYNYIVGGAESANTTVTCNVNQTLTLTAYGTYLFNYYVTDRANNINHTQLNFTTQAPAVDGGKGGGGGSSLAPEKIIERNLTIQVERCGNFVCEECDSNSPEGCVDETPLSCPLDCKAFSFDEMFCTPIFNCGNWKLAWFTNSAILLVASGMVYMQYKISRLKKMKKKRL